MSEAFEALEDFIQERALDLVQVREDYSWYAPEVTIAKEKLEAYLEVRNHLAELEDIETITFDELDEQASHTWAGVE